MACVLKQDSSGASDALATEGASPTVFVTSQKSPMAMVLTARMRGEPVTVAEDGRVKLPPLVRGTNVLSLIVEGTNRDDDVQLTEDCGDGRTHALKTKFVGATGAGSNPVVSFRIRATPRDS
jgi:hypothetical protein